MDNYAVIMFVIMAVLVFGFSIMTLCIYIEFKKLYDKLVVIQKGIENLRAWVSVKFGAMEYEHDKVTEKLQQILDYEVATRVKIEEPVLEQPVRYPSADLLLAFGVGSVAELPKHIKKTLPPQVLEENPTVHDLMEGDKNG